MNEITYNDTDRLRKIMVGRRIVETRKIKAPYHTDSIEFVLDNGTILKATESYGCGGCSNGYWSVDAPNDAPTQVITNVEVVDEFNTSGPDEATLRMFVYAEGIKTEIVRSSGSDNGYYGWGYEVFVTEKKD
jgi:hypothetical protein